MIAFFLVVSAALGLAVWLVIEPQIIRRRRAALMRRPIPENWPLWVAAHVPALARMPRDLRDRVLGLTQIFVREKHFEGCNGLDVTEEMRVVIGFQASLLVVNRPGIPLKNLYDELVSVLVYPAAFIVDETHHHGLGLVTTGRRALSGQAWEARKVILSWDDIEHPADAGNVVLHEFAHYIDMENDAMDGVPALPSKPDYARWSQAFWEEYHRLQADLLAGRSTLLDPYAATEPAEFFAVVTEVFFENPGMLREQHPGLYAQLQSYYRLDPDRWEKGDSGSGLMRPDLAPAF